MSLTKNEALENGQYLLEFSVDKETFDAATDKAYHKSVKKLNINGFRKGKAPRSVIEKIYGKGFFYEDAINDIIPRIYPEIAKESGLDIVGQPEFDVVSIDDNGLVLSAKVYVKPVVEIKDYAGIEVTKEINPVLDSEVDSEIETVRTRNSREIEVTDRASENDDVVNIDYEGFVDGVAFEGGKGEKYDLKLGSNTFIPGFEEQLIGKNAGDSCDVNVTFPTEYHAPDLAGKEAVFKVKINSINKVELPALDDEFAKDVSEFDTFDEYRNDIKAKLEKRHNAEADAIVEEQLMNALIEKVTVAIPEPMFVEETENFVRDYDNRLRMQGLDLSMYFKYTGLDLDKLREQLRPQAERQVKGRLALEAIAAAENLVPTEAEIDAEFEAIATAYNMEVAKVKELIATDAIAADMKVKKALELVKEKAAITEKVLEAASAEDTAAE